MEGRSSRIWLWYHLDALSIDEISQAVVLVSSRKAADRMRASAKMLKSSLEFRFRENINLKKSNDILTSEAIS